MNCRSEEQSAKSLTLGHVQVFTLTTDMQVGLADSSSYGQQPTNCSNRKQGPCSQWRALCIRCDSTLVISTTFALHNAVDVGYVLNRRGLASLIGSAKVLAAHNGAEWVASTISCRGKCEGTSRINEQALQPRCLKTSRVSAAPCTQEM